MIGTATMRYLVIVIAFLVGCGSSASETCPATLITGDSCAFAGSCWREDTFSSCRSGWCTCDDGAITCEELAPQTGDACGLEPITQCTYEGIPGCGAPTAEFCSCGEDGAWHCECACYGGQSTCGSGCDLPPQQLSGKPCGDEGQVCTYPGNVSCRCQAGTPGNDATFVCSVPRVLVSP